MNTNLEKMEKSLLDALAVVREAKETRGMGIALGVVIAYRDRSGAIEQAAGRMYHDVAEGAFLDGCFSLALAAIHDPADLKKAKVMQAIMMDLAQDQDDQDE